MENTDFESINRKLHAKIDFFKGILKIEFKNQFCINTY